MGTVRFVACFDMVGWQTGIWLYAVIQIELVWLFIMPIKFAVFLEFLWYGLAGCRILSYGSFLWGSHYRHKVS